MIHARAIFSSHNSISLTSKTTLTHLIEKDANLQKTTLTHHIEKDAKLRHPEYPGSGRLPLCPS